MKKVTIEVLGNEAVDVSRVVCSSQYFKVEKVTQKEGKLYEFEVTPKETAKSRFGVVKFQTDSAIERFKKGQFFLVVSKLKPSK